MTLQTKLHFFAVLLALALMLPLVGCDALSNKLKPTDLKETSQTGTVVVDSDPRLFFGNISNATSDAKDKDNFLMFKTSAAISYNNSRGTANWIMWRTTRNDIGDRLDRPDFQPDQDLPRGFTRIVHSDYSGSGFQRGHLVPSADRFGNIDQNAETFLMTNIVPQLSDLNENAWEKLESYLRSQARRGKDVYQIAGGYGNIKKLKGKVIVPSNCWKIAAIVDMGTDPAELANKARFIAVDMPNISGISNDNWQKYITSIRDIEQKTGFDLFRSLPKEIQDKIEMQIND